MNTEYIEVQVRFFASIRERMGCGEDRVSVPRGATVAQVWDKVTNGESLQENILIAVNLEYVNPERAVDEKDEIAFFPPVTGG